MNKLRTLRIFLIWIFLIVSAQIAIAMPMQYYSFNNLGGVTQKLCVRSIVQSADGMIWLATESGLYSYDGYHLIRRTLNESIFGNKDTGSFNCLLADGDSLLIGCNKGILSYHLKTYTFRLLSYGRDEMVKAITQTGSTIWVATESTIYRNGTKLEPCPDHIVSLNSDETSLYIGTMNAVYTYSLKDRQLAKFTDGVTYPGCFFPDKKQDNLWIGTATNISIWSKKDRKHIHNLTMPVAKSFCRDKSGNMLTGTDNGLYLIDKNYQVVPVLHDARRENSLAGDAVWCIFRDRSNNIWIGTNAGVSVVSADDRMQTYSLPSITGEGTGNQFFCVYSDSKGRWWLGGSNGLLCIERPGKENQAYRWYRMKDTRYPILHNRIRDILEDSKGNLFIGGDMGLMVYDEVTQQFQRYEMKEEPLMWVYGIRESKKGELIITTFTNTYLGTLDRVYHRINVEKVTQRELLKSNKEKILLERYGLAETYLSAFYDSRNETVLLGGTDRFSVLNTKKLNESRKNRTLTITDARINGEQYVDHKYILQGEVVLMPEDRVVEVMFSDLNYTSELNYSYLYRMDDGEWLSVHSTNNTIVLTNLSPGTHTLSIRFSDTTKAATVFILTVRTPWYATSPAKSIYLLLLLCLIYGIYHIIRQRKRISQERVANQELLLKAKQKEKELLSDKEYLAVQLRLQLQAKAGVDGDLSEDEKFLLKITKIVEDNMSDPDLNIHVICEIAGLSSKQLYRRIKSITGLTTVAYIRDLRLKKAASLLAVGSFTVSEVMYMVGFSNPSYFTRCFTEEYKTPPSEYKG